jgi:hypothetical protein
MAEACVDELQRRRQVRRTALTLGVIAIGIYLAFIVFSVLRASH